MIKTTCKVFAIFMFLLGCTNIQVKKYDLGGHKVSFDTDSSASIVDIIDETDSGEYEASIDDISSEKDGGEGEASIISNSEVKDKSKCGCETGGINSVFRANVRVCVVESKEMRSGDVFSSFTCVCCDEPHNYEIFSVLEYPSDGNSPYDKTLLRDFADRECEQGFEDYIQYSRSQSLYQIVSWIPTEESWNDLDDREVVCLLSLANGSAMTEPVGDADITVEPIVDLAFACSFICDITLALACGDDPITRDECLRNCVRPDNMQGCEGTYEDFQLCVWDKDPHDWACVARVEFISKKRNYFNWEYRLRPFYEGTYCDIERDSLDECKGTAGPRLTF